MKNEKLVATLEAAGTNLPLFFTELELSIKSRKDRLDRVDLLMDLTERLSNAKVPFAEEAMRWLADNTRNNPDDRELLCATAKAIGNIASQRDLLSKAGVQGAAWHSLRSLPPDIGISQLHLVRQWLRSDKQPRLGIWLLKDWQSFIDARSIVEDVAALFQPKAPVPSRDEAAWTEAEARIDWTMIQHSLSDGVTEWLLENVPEQLFMIIIKALMACVEIEAVMECCKAPFDRSNQWLHAIEASNRSRTGFSRHIYQAYLLMLARDSLAQLYKDSKTWDKCVEELIDGEWVFMHRLAMNALANCRNRKGLAHAKQAIVAWSERTKDMRWFFRVRHELLVLLKARANAFVDLRDPDASEANSLLLCFEDSLRVQIVSTEKDEQKEKYFDTCLRDVLIAFRKKLWSEPLRLDTFACELR